MSAANKFACDWSRGIAAAKLERLAKKAGPDSSTAGVVVATPKPGPNVLNPFVSAPARTHNPDGTPYIAQVSATISKPAPTVIGNTSPYIVASDRSRTPAKAPSSTQNGNFSPVDLMPVNDMTGVGGLRPGEVELLAGHGINVGLTGGVLTLQRKYHLAASAVLFAARGQ